MIFGFCHLIYDPETSGLHSQEFVLIQIPHFFHPFVVEHFANITAAMIVEQYNHNVIFRKFILQLQ